MQTCDYEQDFHFYHKMKCKTADKTLEQHFLKEFKATCKNPGNPELHVKQQKVVWNVIYMQVGYALSTYV